MQLASGSAKLELDATGKVVPLHCDDVDSCPCGGDRCGEAADPDSHDEDVAVQKNRCFPRRQLQSLAHGQFTFP